MSYTVLARRYRSRDFNEIVGQEPIARTLEQAIEQNRTAHAYLFCGTRGVGKTSMARIFAKALNATDDLAEPDKVADAIMRGEDLDVIEIDGASNRGVQEARDLIAGAGLSPTRGHYKIYIIDEVHMLTREAFNTLLKTMEEPPPHVKFILCTTEPHKVPATIQSRCQRFDFRPLPSSKIAEQLRMILKQEKVKAEDEVISHVARLGNGSMRDALSLLDRLLAAGEKKLTISLLQETLGLPDTQLVNELVEAIIEGDPAKALRKADDLLRTGATVEQMMEMLADHFRTLMVISACGVDSTLLELSQEALDRAAKQAEGFDPAGLVHLIAMCDHVGRNARGSTTARAIFDATIVRLAQAEHLADIARLLAGNGQALATSPAPALRKKKVATPSRDDGDGDGDCDAASHEAPAASPRLEREAAQFREHIEQTTAPAPAAPRVSEESDIPLDADAWSAALRGAKLSANQQTLFESLVFDGCEGRTITFRAITNARLLMRKTDTIAPIIEQITGRRLRVQIKADESAEQSSAIESGAVSDALRAHPAVREAQNLFDAVVIGVSPSRFTQGGAGADDDGATDDLDHHDELH